MTISVTNTTSDVCLICHENYTSTERADTAKVVELACHHFYHLDCVSPWFAQNENATVDLACCYQCEPSLMPKRSHPDSIINAETVERRFSELEQNQNLSSRSELINCLEQLKPHSNSIANLLNGIVQSGGSEDSYKRLKNWIIANVQEESRSMACLVTNEILQGASALRSLPQEIKRLAAIPITDWAKEIKEEGVPVYYSDSNGEYRMRVSKDYLQRATYAYLYQNIHDIEKFENNLGQLENLYDYDQEVLDAIYEARNLQKTISDTIKKHAYLPIDQIILSINELVNTTHLSENSKRIIPSIIKEIVSSRGALRTLNQETDRWKKEPIEMWPTKLKEQGIYFLDSNNKLKRLDGESFAAWVRAAQRAETTVAVANEMFQKGVGFLITQFFNSLI